LVSTAGIGGIHGWRKANHSDINYPPTTPLFRRFFCDYLLKKADRGKFIGIWKENRCLVDWLQTNCKYILWHMNTTKWWKGVFQQHHHFCSPCFSSRSSLPTAGFVFWLSLAIGLGNVSEKICPPPFSHKHYGSFICVYKTFVFLLVLHLFTDNRCRQRSSGW
jgi:hypothetical protein